MLKERIPVISKPYHLGYKFLVIIYPFFVQLIQIREWMISSLCSATFSLSYSLLLKADQVCLLSHLRNWIFWHTLFLMVGIANSPRDHFLSAYEPGNSDLESSL